MYNQRGEAQSEAPSLKKSELAAILQSLADPALTRLEADDLSSVVLRCLHDLLQADNLALLLLTEDHTALHIHTVLGVEEAVAYEVSVPLGRGFAGRIITQGVPLMVHDPSPLEILTPILREQLHSLLGVPLIVNQQVIGVLHVGMKRDYLFTDADVALLVEVAGYLAQAFERTILIEAEQHEFEELIEAQLGAIVALLHAQQWVVREQMQAQQQVAGALREVQQQTAGEMVQTQQQAAGEMVEVQQQTAGEKVQTQQHMTEEIAQAQPQVTGELAQAQQRVIREQAEVQQQIAGELVQAKQQIAGELVQAQQQTAGELVQAQQQTAGELVQAQQLVQREAFELVNELETIFNAIMDGILVYDEHKQILCSNKTAQHLLGIEKRPVDLHTPSRLSWNATYHLKNGEEHSFSSEQLPLKRLLSGERLTAKHAVTVHFHTLDDRDVLLSVTGAPLFTQKGHLYGAVCVLRDVTTRKHMERRTEILDGLLQMVELLVKSSAQKEQVLPQDAPAMVLQQIESNILTLARRLLGCSYAIIIGIHPSTQVLSPLALAGFSTEQEQQVRTAFAGAHLSLLITDPNDVALLEKQESVPFTITQSPLLPFLSPMRSSPACHLVPIQVTHHLIGLLGVVLPEGPSLLASGEIAIITAISKLCALALQYAQQTTERELLMAAKILLNKQLEQVNKMQSDFISVVSHEFRTSLTTIEGFSNLLRSEEYPNEEVKDYANDIYTDAVRLHRIVTDVLDVEQMKQGKMPLRVVGIDMNRLLTTTAKHMELVSTRHTLRLFLEEKLPLLEGDPEKLLQVITNVLSNAIKYSPMGGEILIKSSREGNAVHVSIQDQGIGIASEVIDSIFTPYHRVTSISTSYIQGTGLGLSLVREIISLHQGKVWVESTLRQGSTFHFSLPLTRETFTPSHEESPFEVQTEGC